jgi:hypothetical protein
MFNNLKKHLILLFMSIMAPIAFFNIPGRNIKISSLVFKGLLSCPMDWAWAFHKYMACKAL